MAYFDNPANRKSWEQAMEGLRAERERRMAGEEPEAVTSLRYIHTTEDERVPVSYQQLLEEYRLERMGTAPERGVEHAVDKSPVSPEHERNIEGPAL